MTEVKKDVFSRYLDLVSLKGESNSREAVLNSSKDENSILLVTSNKIVALRGVYKGDLGDLGVVGLDNIKLISDFIKRISTETVMLEVKSNKLIVRPKDGSSVLKAMLRSPEYILNTVTSDKFDGLVSKVGEDKLVIKGEDITNIINYFSIIANSRITLKKVGNDLQCRVGDEQNDIGVKIAVEGACSDFTIELPNLWVDMLSVIGNNDLVIGVCGNEQLYMKIDSKDYVFEYIIAAVVEAK